MVNFNFSFDLNVSVEQRIGFEMAAAIWSSFLTDDVEVNLHIGAVETLGDNGQAVGGAVPIFHETNYGVYQEYLEQDATSDEDEQVLEALQDGNTVDVVVDGQLIDGNTDIMLTRAQAKALGMEDPLQLENGGSWDRDVLQDSHDLDGYILINNTFDWNYDLTRQDDAPEDTLDFLTMALHEVGHALGFVSGLDGLIETFTFHSGEQRTEGFTALDLMRYSETSSQVENADGSVSDLSFGNSAYFSIDGGQTSLAEFEEGDRYQASHWQRFRNALGIMDPTLGYQERTDISQLDLTAFDAIGWDINYDALENGLNLDNLYADALQTVGGNADTVIAALMQGEDWASLGHEAWFEQFKDQVLTQGWGTWFQGYDSQILELGWGTWFQKFEKELDKSGWKKWLKDFEDEIFEQGWGTWFQDIEVNMLEQGWGTWFQALEGQLLQQLWGTWFQSFEDQLLNQLWGTWFQSFEGEVLEQGWGTWFQNFEAQILEQGWGTWFQNFEGEMLAQNWGTWFQEFDSKALKQDWGNWFQEFDGDVLEQGWGTWFQNFESQALEQGWGTWFQENEDQLLEQGWGTWFQEVDEQLLEQGWGTWFQKFESQVLEQGWGTWFQQLDQFSETLDAAENNSETEAQIADGGVGGANTTIYQGGEDDDIIAGDQKQDRIRGGAGDDLVDGKGGHDVIWGEAGRDILYGERGNDLIYGGDDDDLIVGESGNDELYGEAGHDIISGGRGDDIVSGGAGKDDLKGGSGRDVVSGGDGDDRLAGEANNDILIGGAGQDQIDGGSGDDIIYGDELSESEIATLQELRAQLQSQAIDPNQPDSDSTPPNTANPIRVEAEDMELSGDYDIFTGFTHSSGQTILRTRSAATATTTFAGEAGQYLVVARYFDNDLSQGSLSIGLNGQLLDDWQLDRDDDRNYSRTVAQSIQLKPGDEFAISAQAAGSNSEPIHFDYLEFIPLDNLIVTNLDTSPSGDSPTSTPGAEISPGTTSDAAGHSTIRIEAENMTLAGDYARESRSFASGGKVIKVAQKGEGKALTTFGGETGFYNIVIAYHDENDGIAELSTSLNGIEFDRWLADQDLGSAGANSNTLVTRTVASSIILSTGDVFELNSLSGKGGNASFDQARIDYVEFIKVDAPVSSSENSAPVPEATPPAEPIILGDSIRIEAESMSLAGGYYIENNGTASNNQVIRTNSLGNEPSTASTAFTGDSGYYNIVVTYYDETDGVSRLTVDLDNVELDSWQLDLVSGDDYATQSSKVSRTVGQQVQLDTGDVLTFKGFRDYNEHVRIDHVEFIPVSAPTHSAGLATTSNDDVLQGGNGNDIVMGGEGNDLIYGESKTDSSTTQLKGAQTYNGHTYLFSQAGSWYEAQAEARRLGGNLVTINDATEESWLRDTFGSTERLWTGLNDATVEGQFTWVSGEAVTYTNWSPGEPRSSNGAGQDYGTINYTNRQGNSTNHWDDTDSDGASEWIGSRWVRVNGFRGIIEINNVNANNDILSGGQGDDTIYGQAGNDTIYGDELTTTNSSSSSTLANGLVAHWDFNEASGNVAGDATGHHSATLNNANGDQWQGGQTGGALNFDGSNDYGTVADSAALDITDTLTLSTWVKADSFDYWDGLINKGSYSIPYGLDLTNDGRLIFQTNYGFSSGERVFTSNASLNQGQWQHVAVTYDGSNVRFYIDGQLDSTQSANLTFETNNESLILGADFTANAHFDGAMDDARIYNRALNENEVEELATGGQTTGSSGNDNLYGNSGNDALYGGAGNDTLNGTDGIAAGFLERDILVGGAGADTFVVGDANGAYYLGNGDRDYALIQDFNSSTDIIQLQGAANDYTQQYQGGSTQIYHNNGGSSDLVAIVENTSAVNLFNGSSTSFV